MLNSIDCKLILASRIIGASRIKVRIPMTTTLLRDTSVAFAFGFGSVELLELVVVVEAVLLELPCENNVIYM